MDDIVYGAHHPDMLHIKEEARRCLLCEDAPCTKACKTGDPARAIRAIRFDNAQVSGQWIAKCTDEDLEAAEKACIHYDRPVRIKELVRATCGNTPCTEKAAPSLSIDFCGIHCENHSSLLRRQSVRTTTWLPGHLRWVGLVFSIKLSVNRTSVKYHLASML